MPSISISRVILYVKDIPEVAAFYQNHFGLVPLAGAEDGWLELGYAQGGCTLALHQAAKSQVRGSEIKIVFGVADVHLFKAERAAAGLHFGVVHETGTHAFANAKDPAGNAIQISSRGISLTRATP